MRALHPPLERMPLYGAASSRAIERQNTHLPLMERAGLAVAKLALALWPGSGPIWVACGPGNNGGDGLVAARWLAAHGLPVHVSLSADAGALPPDAAAAHARALAAGLPIHAEPPDTTPALIVDALLGLGLSRPPAGAVAASLHGVAKFAAQGARVLAVDLPSGLMADTGTALGEHTVRADHTLSLLTLKPGLFTGAGRAHAGQVWFDDLDVSPPGAHHPADAELLGDDALRPMPRDATAHKGSQGSVRVVGGAAGMEGAARLAARAALAAGAGRVYLDALSNAPGPADPAWPELMRAGAEPAVAQPGVVTLAGCGGGAAIATHLPGLLAQAARLVLDADALNAVAGSAALTSALQARTQPTVLTPHPLEAARLLGCTVPEIQADRLRAAQNLAERYGCSVVLKGSGSVIASPGHRLGVCPRGSAALASAGTGDVLAGWLAGLWAPEPEADLHALCGRAVSQHGAAGEALPLRASTLIERLSATLGAA
ncbi:NAD(P)H-hydrate dehydratase [Roseateles paludis]|jgi:hydroxyethylthiazole kinase-like uncharacterized protein yjeF|uniref:Bifunctional NAD(P)H-hydrate repair enzyme n=1 Tax=Roseateles paludis TaxID=3145238 RepID=A0ABV0G546_9BURK